jgi:hypothetical protein
MKFNIKIDYTTKRKERYPEIEDQLDSLYHAIDSGKFGENAKLSKFYIDIKNVKEDIPKI